MRRQDMDAESVQRDGENITREELDTTVKRFRRVGGAYEAIASRIETDHPAGADARMEAIAPFVADQVRPPRREDEIRSSGWSTQ